MKYLKKFNELKSSTYRRAAKMLQNDFPNRAKAMTDYVASVEERERLERIKTKRETYAHTGVFKASIVLDKMEVSGSNRILHYVSPLKEKGIEGEMTGNFHLALFFDEGMLNDMMYDYISGSTNIVWMNFTIGIVAADDETAEWFDHPEKGVRKWDFYWDGSYGPNRPYVKLTNDAGNFDPSPMRNEIWENDRFVFEGRKEAVKFRKLMIDIFEGLVDMPVNLIDKVKKAITHLPTFDKTMETKRILERNIPGIKFESIEKLKRAIVNLKDLNNLIKENSPDISEEVITKIVEEVTAMLNQKGEEEYRIFVDKSIRQIKLNDFYR